MIDTRSLIRLHTWLSPAFPTGAFAYSHGLESAIDIGVVDNRVSLQQWLEAQLSNGAGWNDAVLLAQTWHLAKRGESPGSIAELAKAMAQSRERHLETMAQGSAFLSAAGAWSRKPVLPHNCALPVAVGYIAAINDCPLDATIGIYLQAYISNQVQASLRLMKLGQQEGVTILEDLEDEILDVAQKACRSDLDNLGSCCFMADLTAMNHEKLETRIFRS